MSVYVYVVLFIHYVKRMCSITFSSVPCLAPAAYSTLRHKRNDFRKRILNVIHVFGFSLKLYQVVSFPQVSPLKPCMHLSCFSYVPHVLPISVFLTWSREWHSARSKEQETSHLQHSCQMDTTTPGSFQGILSVAWSDSAGLQCAARPGRRCWWARPLSSWAPRLHRLWRRVSRGANPGSKIAVVRTSSFVLPTALSTYYLLPELPPPPPPEHGLSSFVGTSDVSITFTNNSSVIFHISSTFGLTNRGSHSVTLAHRGNWSKR